MRLRARTATGRRSARINLARVRAAVSIAFAAVVATAVLAGPFSMAALANGLASPGTQAISALPIPAPIVAAGTPAERAAAYLVSQLTDGDHFESGGFIQYGITVDVEFGLIAADSEPASTQAIAAFLDTSETVIGYTHGGGFDRKDAVYAGPTAKLALAAMFAGLDPTDVGDEDLLANLAALEAPTGRFSDVSKFGDFSNVFGQSFAVLAQTAATGVQPDAAAVAFLMGAQCPDGGFPIDFPTGGACESAPDATALAIQALDAADPIEGPFELPAEREDSLVCAVRWLEDTRAEDGSWAAFGAPNVNATGYASMALLAVGQAAETSIAWLESVQHEDGGLPIAPGDPDSDVFATAQALEAMAATSFLSMNATLLEAVVLVPPGGTPTPTETPTATPTGSTTPTPTGTLPGTGASKASVLATVGAALALIGVVFLLAARRLKRRP